MADRFDDFLAAALVPAERLGDRKFVARVPSRLFTTTPHRLGSAAREQPAGRSAAPSDRPGGQLQQQTGSADSDPEDGSQQQRARAGRA